ncbi:MetQ/NlpA family ABC transporter substrate-binding protein [Aerococcus kribbianus]|uniref:Lipoprotein n=1 Tax=Aerococcus kribbianus TaxID=2999064 RepID=A0A9X3FNZ2_9LACT|nr:MULTISPECIES: MetQ/NlpA family ABC transporter substrate-binding protein [unclassified Aerococcus]MCZ0717961.1 MetQ/NlpA family ABC transporter substrate-binding protein [Aerococcus sp. YH-aer221]MCZ0726248.1 MetQ/NlpA family ABC transporter substrate-binding protein [Aerococcus sp. YH-aer222]
MNKWTKGILALGASLLLAACGQESTTVKLGVVGDDTSNWDHAQEVLADENIDLEFVKFTDYSQPNSALAEGEIDLNAFQHQVFLENYNKEAGTDLVSIGNTVIVPLGLYSNQVDSPEEIKDGDTIAIPNDVTNGGRALLVLQAAGLIEVDPDKGITPTVSDITKYNVDIEIKELDASQTARALNDVTASIINSGVAVDAGLNPSEDPIFFEPVDENAKPYANIIAARKEDEDNETYNKVVDAFQTDETAQVIKEESNGADLPAWELFGRK